MERKQEDELRTCQRNLKSKKINVEIRLDKEEEDLESQGKTNISSQKRRDPARRRCQRQVA